MKSYLAPLLGIAAAVRAQVQTSCQGDVCYSVHVPQSAASSGSGDIYFQIKAPSTYAWAGFGQGDGMAGSNMFVIYSDSSKTNVTLSARSSTGHVEPEHDSVAKVSLVAGSGIANGQMTANVRCQNCNNWGTGTMQFNDPNSNWIWAWKQGGPLASDSTSATIDQHDDKGQFNFDLTKAAGGANSQNPFVSAGGGGVASPSSSSGSGSSPSSPPSSPSSSSSSSSSSDGGNSSEVLANNMLIAHGALMSLAMVLLFPLGAMLRRFGRVSIWMHAAWQIFAWIVSIAGMSIGIWIAITTEQLDVSISHPIIGLVVVCGLSLQPIGGLLQHRHFRKHDSRSVFGWGHKVLGVSLILLGIINGGLGFELSGNSTNAEVAYAVIAVVMGGSMLALMVFGSAKKRVSRSKTESPTRSD